MLERTPSAATASRRELDLHARRLGGRVRAQGCTQALLEEVADLVEFPGVVAGFYPAEFLELPQEVLTTTLVHHQHYFPVVDDDGTLKEAFLAVMNTRPGDERVIAKNAERVVVARLRDAKFFWDADRKVDARVAARAAAHADLPQEAGQLSRQGASGSKRWRAGLPATCSGAPTRRTTRPRPRAWPRRISATDMVFEFPELQGTMGGIYAREEGQPEAVWKAIYHHYLPIARRSRRRAVASAAR